MRVHASALVLLGSLAVCPVFAATQKAKVGDDHIVMMKKEPRRPARKQEEEGGGGVDSDYNPGTEQCVTGNSPGVTCPDGITLYMSKSAANPQTDCSAEGERISPAVNPDKCSTLEVMCTIVFPYDPDSSYEPNVCPDWVVGDDIDGPCFTNEAQTYPKGTSSVDCEATINAVDTMGTPITPQVISCSPPTSVEVVDDVPPTLTGCPIGVETLYTSMPHDHCDAYFDASQITASDACDGPDLYVSGVNDYYNLGTTLVTASATDYMGNTATCSFAVEVVDDYDPYAICPASPVMAYTDDNVCYATYVIYTTDCDDDCYSCTVYDDAPSIFPGPSSEDDGETTVTVTAYDDAGNTDTCTFDVEVHDHEDPECTASDQTLATDPGVCYSTVAITDCVMPSDNCGVADYTIEDPPLSSPDRYPLGVTNVDVYVEDVNGNTNYYACVFDVTVQDREPPTLFCSDVYLGVDKGTCEVAFDPAADAGVIASDNCDGDLSGSVTYSGPGAVIFGPGIYHYTATATDSSGNSGTCDFELIVKDNQSPEICCDGVGEVYDPTSMTDQLFTVADNCDIRKVICEDKFNHRVWSPDTGYGYVLGQSDAPDTLLTGHGTCTVIDTFGNKATCSHKFKPPPLTVACPCFTLQDMRDSVAGSQYLDQCISGPNVYSADIDSNPEQGFCVGTKCNDGVAGDLRCWYGDGLHNSDGTFDFSGSAISMPVTPEEADACRQIITDFCDEEGKTIGAGGASLPDDEEVEEAPDDGEN